ncbi:MAG: ATPase domain-containing protein [Thermoplasmata archaeon]
MAPRSSSKRSSTAARDRPPPRSPGPKVESAEVRRSRRAAILQLRMGRLGHIIGIASGLALALTAIIVYGLQNWEVFAEAPEMVVELKWTIPLVAGLIVAVAALWVKWEPYVADRDEPHFVVSLAAVIVPAMLIAIVFLRDANRLLLDSSDWLYPASFLGISLTEISLAMTWEGTSRRKTISIVAALFPIALLSFPLVYHPAEAILASILPMAYLGSAVSIQLSGSMLHIIASSTSVQQREVLKASDSKLREELIEIEKKKEALAYREEALRGRESDVEAYERKLMDEMASVEEQRSQVEAMRSEAEQMLQAARDAKQALAAQEAKLERAREALQLRTAEAESKQREMEKLVKSVEAREAALSAREREVARLQLELQSRERDLSSRLAEVKAEEMAARAEMKRLDDLEKALAEREKQLAAKEDSLDIKSLEVMAVKEQLGKVEAEKLAVKKLEQQLLERQKALTEREVMVKTLEDDLQRKAERAERLSARADQQLNELVDRESKLLEKEKMLAEKEASLRSDLMILKEKLDEMERARATVSDRERQFQDLSETTRTKLSALTQREEELSRKMAALEKREQKIKELEAALKSEKEGMSAKLRELIEKEKSLKAAEAELSLRHAELKAMEREILERVDELEYAREAAPEEEEREKVLALRERRLIEKEQEMKARLYQREKELEKKELALKAQLSKDLEEMEEAVEQEYAGEKVKTGIERLDDLLMGGMPFGSNVLYVGPPFIGKEVAMLLFLAEGLKKGVPVVIVTTSHTPAEIMKDMAPILPAFMEFDQLGLVRWIDATVAGESAPVPGTKPTWSVKVSGPGDLDGITKALDACIRDFVKQKHPYFRLAYMSLSMSVTQAEEKAAFQFVQGLAGRVKNANAVAVYAVERGMHTEQQLEAIQHHMTGAVQFKTEKQKTLLSVQGVCDVQTRAWVEYRHTNKALMIGAFSLERIR